MDSEHLPVWVAAGCSLYLFIWKQCCKLNFEGHLDHILERYLSIMNDIDHEELVSALEEIVREFCDKIGPFAKHLAVKLVEKYNDMVWNANEEDAGYGES